MQVGDEVRRMHAGDIVQVPGNVPHAFCRVYRDTRWLEFFHPRPRGHFAPGRTERKRIIQTLWRPLLQGGAPFLFGLFQ